MTRSASWLRVPSSSVEVNVAEVMWLMAPEAPEPELRLEDFLRRPEWHSRAACRGVDVDVFFPGRGGDLRPAKALCAGCPVRDECLAVAMADTEIDGIWAATSGRERARIRRTLRGRRAERSRQGRDPGV